MERDGKGKRRGKGKSEKTFGLFFFIESKMILFK